MAPTTILTTILTVQHEDDCPPGLVGEWLTQEGVALDVRRPYASGLLPASLDGFSGLMVLGGHMGANDDDAYPWLTPTKALIREAATTGLPVLGICLGHQLAAAALGGEVRRNPAGKRRGALDMGWGPAAADDPVLDRCGPVAVQWHRDVVSRVPEGTVEAARAQTGELLAARFAPSVWGVQCHPEASPDIVARWAARDRRGTQTDREAAAVDAALAQVRAEQSRLAQGWRPLAVAFAAQVLAL